MKKLFTLILAFSVMAMALCSCGAGNMPTLSEAMGSVDGDVYSSDCTGLKFTLSGDWRFLTDDEIESITGTTQDILDEAGTDADFSSQVYAMMAMDDNTANNVNVMVQLVSGDSDIDYDEILDASEQQILEMGASIGANYTFSEHSSATLSGIDFKKLTASAEFSGVTFEQGCYIAIVDNVAINIAITSYDGTPVETIEAMFN